jgi:hypothetical protein
VTIDRRNNDRQVAWFPIRLDADDLGEGIAIAKDVSETGICIASTFRYAVGAPVSLTLHLDPATDVTREVAGTIVRMMDNDEDPDGMWPHKIGIEFDDPDPELVESVRRLLGA